MCRGSAYNTTTNAWKSKVNAEMSVVPVLSVVRSTDPMRRVYYFV